MFYLQDSSTSQKESLRTKDRSEAEKIWSARNESARQPQLAAAMAKAYLFVKDPKLATRTWFAVMEEMARNGQPQTQERCRREIRTKALDPLRNKTLVETTAEDFLHVLRGGGIMLREFLRRMQNLALGMGWIAWPVLPPRLWPKVQKRVKRGITSLEQTRILDSEQNPKRKLYYQLLWEIGAAQSDAARFPASAFTATAMRGLKGPRSVATQSASPRWRWVIIRGPFKRPKPRRLFRSALLWMSTRRNLSQWNLKWSGDR